MKDNREISFVAHLEEMRICLLKSLGIILVFTCVSIAFAPRILKLLTASIDRLIFTAPQEAFVAHVVVAFWCGLFLSLPFVFYQIWKFISAGLYDLERKHVFLYAPISFVLFLLGACFGYFVIVPIGLKFLLGFGSESLVPMISLGKYLSFVGLLTFNFGVVFELPIVMVFLTSIGIVTPDFFSAKRRYGIVLLFVVAAVLTPPDVVTQGLMVVPLIILFEVGVVFSKFAYKRKK